MDQRGGAGRENQGAGHERQEPEAGRAEHRLDQAHRGYVRFITEGKQTELRGKTIKGGYTVWKMKAGHPVAIHVDTLDKAVKECLK